MGSSEKIVIVVSTADGKAYDVSIRVPTAFGTYIETQIATGVKVSEADMISSALETGFRAIGIEASEVP